ncbi:hypothetical protein AVL59_21170 [Streptomyces griseochromogenes]|uniref:Uncharacterized protein n=1 Tax=Streptomyces griseochromogenes TaxID=68214 RepID=A0A1B1AYV7_9ACTN|nr:hypothetical protein AVL59_21170 [Streptomyces griseochromogenes]
MRDTAACDHRFDGLGPDEPAVLVVVVAAVCEQRLGPPARASDQAWDRRGLVQQGQELGDVVAVSAGQRHCERDALAFDEDMMFTARPCAVDRTRPAFGPRRAARAWEESVTARDQSNCLGTSATADC